MYPAQIALTRIRWGAWVKACIVPLVAPYFEAEDVAMTLIAKMRFQSATVFARWSFSISMPAVLTEMSSLPPYRAVRSMAARTSSSEVTSRLTKVPLLAFRGEKLPSSMRFPARTVAPSRRKRSHVARPILARPPLTRAILPSSILVILGLHERRPRGPDRESDAIRVRIYLIPGGRKRSGPA